MANERAKHLERMREIRIAINKTESPYLKRDYQKAYKRMKKALRMYDALCAKRG